MNARGVAVALVASLAACSDSGLQRVAVEVQWMEWPAEVLPGHRFEVRLVGYGPGCARRIALRVPVRIDQSAVTFEPYFLVSGTDPEILCAEPVTAGVTAPSIPIDIGFYDTLMLIAQLPAEYPRTYEMRGAAAVYVPASSALAELLPVRTFGEIAVRDGAAAFSPIGVGGNVYMVRDTLGCIRVVPIAPIAAAMGYVVENPPADTTALFGFVRGYLYAPAQPVCGATSVLHLTWTVPRG